MLTHVLAASGWIEARGLAPAVLVLAEFFLLVALCMSVLKRVLGRPLYQRRRSVVKVGVALSVLALLAASAPREPVAEASRSATTSDGLLVSQWHAFK